MRLSIVFLLNFSERIASKMRFLITGSLCSTLLKCPETAVNIDDLHASDAFNFAAATLGAPNQIKASDLCQSITIGNCVLWPFTINVVCRVDESYTTDEGEGTLCPLNKNLSCNTSKFVGPRT